MPRTIGISHDFPNQHLTVFIPFRVIYSGKKVTLERGVLVILQWEACLRFRPRLEITSLSASNTVWSLVLVSGYSLPSPWSLAFRCYSRLRESELRVTVRVNLFPNPSFEYQC